MNRALDLLAGLLGLAIFYAACHGLAVAVDLTLHRWGL